MVQHLSRILLDKDKRDPRTDTEHAGRIIQNLDLDMRCSINCGYVTFPVCNVCRGLKGVLEWL